MPFGVGKRANMDGPIGFVCYFHESSAIDGGVQIRDDSAPLSGVYGFVDFLSSLFFQKFCDGSRFSDLSDPTLTGSIPFPIDSVYSDQLILVIRRFGELCNNASISLKLVVLKPLEQ